MNLVAEGRKQVNMATPLDLLAFQEFQGVFAFLFILIGSYAILGSAEFFKERKFPLTMISFLLAFMALSSTIAIKTVSLMAPWFVLFMLFVLIMMLGFMTLGVTMPDIIKFLKEGEYAVGIWMLVILLLIGVGSLAVVWTEETGGLDELRGFNETKYKSGEYPVDTFWQTVFHPNMLGFVLVLIIAVFTLKYMTEETK